MSFPICFPRSVDAPTSSQIGGDIKIEPKPDPPKGPKSHTVGEAMKCIDFYLLWGIVFLDIISVVLLTSTYKIYGLQSKFDDQFLSAVATVSAAFNCLGRVFWGFMVDRFSSKCPSALLTAAIISQFKLAGQWIPVYTLCGCTCLIAFILALFIRDKDAHCVGFTNNICAAICDPLRKGYLEETLEDLDETFESDGPSSIALQKSA
ncbi:oxalate:formate antiporter [Echinococcus granulosus]|uniref:Oxalate:formate antiporter n=1 Tax=Echinococcus granulosus TaxID=6210 RepID=W6UKY1_ECHGR|nr:oxalate:formate antiporter [Echinococcus granulosus]EUB54154.1 oxalate:formate antiporter [Echinococcus granulosus]